MCIVLTNLPCCTSTNQALNLLLFFTSDAPGVPINITAEEILDSNPNDDSCMIIIHLCPPNNTDMNHIDRYFIQFPSGDGYIPNTGSGTIRVPNCRNKDNIRLNVSAVNICGTVGASTMFSTGSDLEASSTLASTTLCAVLLVISILSS